MFSRCVSGCCVVDDILEWLDRTEIGSEDAGCGVLGCFWRVRRIMIIQLFRTVHTKFNRPVAST
jgi:hypothetical protein